ncbi:stellacyanin-like [Telopea speciosissima]|uniref:stellacyanin-like n=1 Tax=Telopea speciosissima TaxID=54955 RepID=UPI001CC7684D|nr:stellacyanin-like [Telopea speciosissima]
MASHFKMASFKILLLSILLSSTHFFSVNSHEFEVGDDKGWLVPSSKDDDFYDQWASKQRFQVNDTVNFKYKEDSVLVVRGDEYEECHSTHPIFFSNNGDTTFTLDRPDLFYFISGVSGHCERGQKMIIKVLKPPKSPSPPPPPPASQNGTSEPSGHNGAVAKLGAHPITVPLLVMSVIMVAFFREFF